MQAVQRRTAELGIRPARCLGPGPTHRHAEVGQRAAGVIMAPVVKLIDRPVSVATLHCGGVHVEETPPQPSVVEGVVEDRCRARIRGLQFVAVSGTKAAAQSPAPPRPASRAECSCRLRLSACACACACTRRAGVDMDGVDRSDERVILEARVSRMTGGSIPPMTRRRTLALVWFASHLGRSSVGKPRGRRVLGYLSSHS